jgi:hypothetical protein
MGQRRVQSIARARQRFHDKSGSKRVVRFARRRYGGCRQGLTTVLKFDHQSQDREVTIPTPLLIAVDEVLE